MRTDLSPKEALEAVLGAVSPLPSEAVPAAEADGRVLAEAVRALHSLPPFDNSAMDGFAVRHEDLAEEKLPVTLSIIGEVAAGSTPETPLSPGEALAISTGAPVPSGATAVVPVELTRRNGAHVTIAESLSVGANIRRRASEMEEGEEILPAGHQMTPASVGVAISCGHGSVICHQQPQVAYLPTGNELAEPGEALSGGRIPNSNAYAAMASARQVGAETTYLGIGPDTLEGTCERLRTALACQVIVTMGGVSMGEHDYVLRAVERLGGEVLFWRVRQKPGKPMALAKIGDAFLFALPGNPSSTMLCMESYVKPALLAMQGFLTRGRRTIPATLTAAVSNPGNRTLYLHARLSGPDGMRMAEPLAHQVSGMLRSMAIGNGYIVVAPETDLAEGDKVVAVPLANEDWIAP